MKRVAPFIAIAAGLALATDEASADDPDQVARAERCATRLSIAILGESPAAALRTVGDPQASVPALLQMPQFREKFARFVNAAYNRSPGDSEGADAPYYLAKHVLEQGKPWRDLFVGAYDVSENAEGKATVTDSADGLGYFRSYPWLRRYAGNELEGLKVATAYRMLQNTIGLKLEAVTNEPGADVTLAGRAKQPCAQCHKDNWYALDGIASVLTRRNDDGEDVQFDPPTGGPQTVLGGITVKDDKELVTALVSSEAFSFRQCRLAFNYLYARDENLCEGPIFDTCMAAFTADGKIESAIAAVARNPAFCE